MNAFSPIQVPLIQTAGAYPDISNDDYHGREICPAPSISSTGLKKLVGAIGLQTKGATPRHYWEGSALNPNRRPQEKTDALRLGSAFHDALLLPELWQDRNVYHVTPEGFSRSKTKAMASEIADADAAEAAGCVIITADERDQIDAMVAAMRANPLVNAVLSDGEAETTLAWQDKETGVWLRARPDWMPKRKHIGINVKTTTDASHSGFQSDVTKYRYAMSAALELDGIEAVFGSRPGNYLHPTIEKPAKGAWQAGDYMPVALWELPADDIEYGRAMNRRAIRIFADCLSADRWPGYADEPAMCGISPWMRKSIDMAFEGEAA
ncbi:PD-(D/E)XK nuclease-like domain-containing protein [Sphingomonas faeni]|uniref:PD-(D/E)XK nuclease-like domain-containing protein n=1 Tax=Sphingomonas faeni TaxID=185950 RepID=UPI003357991B